MIMRLTKTQKEKFYKNLLKFTAPILVIFFGQLATGVDWKAAGFVALYAFYAATSDLFSKVKK